MSDPHEVLAGRLRWQAAGCTFLGSPFYGALLEDAAADLERNGPVWEVLREYGNEHQDSATALRLMGAVHRLVLTGQLPELARHYPSAGGDADAGAAWPLFRDALAERRDEIAGLVGRGCQTNEVGRSAALLGGFLEVAHRTHLPLRILEVGASAGLNMLWDRFRYESAAGGWGDETSPVRFTNVFDAPPPLKRTAEVVERRGCDLNPIDPTTDDGALTLRSFVWADQLGRLALLDGAIEVARREPAHVDRANAADFLQRELSTPRSGMATVVYHSVFWQYVDSPARERMRRAVEEAGVFYLTMEPAYPIFEVRLDGELLGTSLAHGTGVRWIVK